MKRLKHLYQILILAALICTSCQKEEKDFYTHPDVPAFVEMLKSGTYDVTDENGFLAVPKFRMYHVPELLEYVEDLTVLPNPFPVNPLYGTLGTHRLGEGLMWVIEGIRNDQAYKIYSGYLMKEEIVNDQVVGIPATDEEILEVAKRYKLWWNGEYPFNYVHDKFNAHPLEGTSYFWF